jgi:hypothetical protein
MFNKGLVFRIIGVILLMGLIAAGGFMTYQAGVAQGTAQAPEVAAAIEKAAESGQAVNVPPMMYGDGFYPHGYGYSYGMHGFGHHFMLFPFGICGSILFVLFFFGLLRMIFRPWRHGHMHGPWGRHWEDGVPPMFNEWHKRAHGEGEKAEEGK